MMGLHPQVERTLRLMVGEYIADGIANRKKAIREDVAHIGASEEQFVEFLNAYLIELSEAVHAAALDYPRYDGAFGDGKLCRCGHQYHRHFDSYDKMEPVGCKYCTCEIFEDPDPKGS